MNTPWGMSDESEKLAEGIINYSTPSHGGIRLSTERQKELGQLGPVTNYLNSKEWWEEDCDWVVPYLFFREAIKAYGKAYKFEENLETAKLIAARYHPEILIPA